MATFKCIHRQHIKDTHLTVLILDNSRCLTETQHQTSSVHHQPQSDDGPNEKTRPNHWLCIV